YGVLAFVLGRIVLVVAGVLPMMFGAVIVLAGRRPVTVLPMLVLAVLGVGALLPASTPPIVGSDGKHIPGSIASLERVQIGGREQWIMMRGHSVDKPVLLYLSGGPGQSDLPFVRI